MTEQFFDEPILNSPYVYPSRHWELDADGQPTNRCKPFSETSEVFAKPLL